MIHPLSSATTYIETYCFSPSDGRHLSITHATGFFVRTKNALLLITSWHVVTGLNPADPSKMNKPTCPYFMKLSVRSKKGWLTEITVPLYDADMTPRWREHPEGHAVDIAVLELPLALENYYDFVDIQGASDDYSIEETIAKEVFILGYPFSKEDMKASFGEGTVYYLPVWKRGSIASEPKVRFGGRMLLIDSLSRPGMSGAPVLIAQDEKVMRAGSSENAAVFDKIKAGDVSDLDSILALDASKLTDGTVKRFNFLGIYSGVIGSTRLAEVALGKCWHAEALRELTMDHRDGVMPYHAPVQNDFYDAFLEELAGGKLIIKNKSGEVTETVLLSGHAT